MNVTTKGLLLTEPGKLKIVERNLSWKIGEDSLLRILFATICGSDIRISKYGDSRITEPRILGHEIVARVVESGCSTKFKAGDVIAVGADIPCGECTFCLSNKSNLCLKHIAFGYQLDGGFSEYMVIPKEHVDLAPIVRINESPSIATYALAEPTGCAINGLRFSNVVNTDNILIFGGGPVGIILALLANLMIGIPKVKILMIEPSSERRDFVNSLGIATASSEIDIVKHDSFFNGASQIFTATSAAITHQSALKNIASGGTINFFGGIPKDSPDLTVHANELHYREIKIGGSHGSRPRDHAIAVEIITENMEIWTHLLTRTYSIDKYKEAFSQAQTASSLKLGFQFEE